MVLCAEAFARGILREKRVGDGNTGNQCDGRDNE
jgi:hypothetical protein